MCPKFHTACTPKARMRHPPAHNLAARTSMSFQKQLQARAAKGGKGMGKLQGMKKAAMAVAGIKQKKPHRWRPGTVALREIKKLQRSTKNLIARSPYVRFMRQRMVAIADKNRGCATVKRLTGSAIEAAQEATQAYLIDVFEKALEATIHANRTTLLEKDVKFAIKNNPSLNF